MHRKLTFQEAWDSSTVFFVDEELENDPAFINLVAELLFDGKRDQELSQYIPRFYLEKLNYREIGLLPQSLREIRYKESTIGTYGARKGHKVEGKIKDFLEMVKAQYNIGYEKGRSRFINVDIDFAIPSLQDPWVILMSSFQETTSSGQTTKARDMLAAYNRITESNSRFGENRAFVNFVDGGGWLARKRDLERLVHECHYFINLQNLDMLEAIILAHVPKTYRQR